MTTKKTTISTAMLFATALLLGACSSDDDAAGSPAGEQATPPTGDSAADPGAGSEGTPVTSPADNPGTDVDDGAGSGADDNPITDAPAEPLPIVDDGPVTETPAVPVPGVDDEPVTGPPTEPGTGTDDEPVTEPPAGPGDPVDGPISGPPPIPTLPTDGPGTSELPGTADTSAIAGLWNISEEEFFLGESEGIDVVYVDIGADGNATYYDYQQDEVDMGDNCYEIESGIVRFLGNNTYAVDPDTIDAIEATIVRNGNTLDVSYVDVNDDNENGDVTETLSFSYPLLTGVDPEFNECSE